MDLLMELNVWFVLLSKTISLAMRVDSKRRMLNAFGDAGGARSESPRKRFISERVSGNAALWYP